MQPRNDPDQEIEREAARLWGAPPPRPWARRDYSNHYGLTLRQWQVIDCVLQGLSWDEMGESMGIKPLTARTHERRLRERLGASSRPQLLRAIWRFASPPLPPIKPPSRQVCPTCLGVGTLGVDVEADIDRDSDTEEEVA